MPARKVVPLALAVAALVALAAIASNGKPLSGSGRGAGPSPTFFDYLATTLVLAAVVLLAVAVYVLLMRNVRTSAPQRGRWHIVSTLLGFAAAAALAVLLAHSHFERRLRSLEQGQPPARQKPVHRGLHSQGSGRGARLRWDEISVFLVLVAGTGVVLLARRRTRRPPRVWRFDREVAQALDESIDDLRSDPDLRRAIISAYARMEGALGRAGIPRARSEAPFEYMTRALEALDASAASARRLTALFERAKFSQHEPEPEMRDEAIAALVAVRDELAAEPVTA
ncbi:MAG TPA: DUF4129 domain-containing protein [Gaiellaceae bacterium]|nr:DUF4129 domain-containing protein [Gaiellaceae bacterium]